MNGDVTDFDAGRADGRADDEPALVVDVEGFEGPLDLLLMLARQQKVDLAKISILALADQFLAFIEEARRLRLELAADYLVMAAWLAYLKSRLLLPEAEKGDGPSAEEMATALAERLRRLEAFRAVADKLMNRPQLGRDLFQRGDPEPIAEIKRPLWSATLYDLLSAYSTQRQRQVLGHVHVGKRTVWSLAEARAALERLIGKAADWSCLDDYLLAYTVEPAMIPTVLASSFAASLELAREIAPAGHVYANLSASASCAARDSTARRRLAGGHRHRDNGRGRNGNVGFGRTTHRRVAGREPGFGAGAAGRAASAGGAVVRIGRTAGRVHAREAASRRR
jgi:segregation and condensation protein A